MVQLSTTLQKFMEKLNIHRFKNYIPIKCIAHSNKCTLIRKCKVIVEGTVQFWHMSYLPMITADNEEKNHCLSEERAQT